MEEGTAGIGEAGALINKAKAPAGLDITKGLAMAQSSALKKAQLEAARAYKVEAIKARMLKTSEINPGIYDNSGVARRAYDKGLNLNADLYMAHSSGDPSAIIQAKNNAGREINILRNEDKAVTALKAKTKYDYMNKAASALDKGDREAASKYSKPYAPLILTNEYGDIEVVAPDAVDFNKIYSGEIKKYAGNDIRFDSAKDEIDGTDNYKINRKLTDNEISTSADSLLKSKNYIEGVVYDPDFQTYYDKSKYQGSEDHDKLVSGVFEYTKKRLDDINIDKSNIRAKRSDNAVTYASDYGVHWGKYDVQVNDMTAQEVLNATYNKKDPTGQHFVVTTNKPVSDNALRVEMQNMVDSDPNAKWKKISLTDTGKLTFKNPVSGETITDGDMTAIYSSGKKIWIEYKTKSEIGGFPTIGVVPMSADILTVLNAKMSGGKKGAGLKETVEAFKKRGIDMSPYVGKVVNTAGGGTGGSRGGSNAVGSAPTITAAQYRAMSVPERTAFRQKKGIIKG
jgi:hypothetical protein